MARHAVVVVCDALHLGCVGCYGSDWVETPAVDRLADAGFVFDQCYPEAPTLGGWWRTGLSAAWPFLCAPTAQVPLLETLAVAGVAIGVSWAHASSRPVVCPEWHIPLPAQASLESQFDAAAAWLQTHHGESTLTWLQLDVALGAWPTPVEFADLYDASTATADTSADATARQAPAADVPAARCAYAARVSYFDAALRAFLDWLRDAGFDDDAFIIVTSDQGYPLGEHGIVGLARPWLYEERAHVPLVVRVGGGARAARSSAPVQSADLAPSLAEHFGLEPFATRAVPLQARIRGDAPPMRGYLCSGLEDVEYAIGTRRWRLLLPVSAEANAPPRSRQLFAKPEDRWEVSDQAAAQPAIADALELQLRRHLDAVRRGSLDLILPLSPDV